MLQIIGLLVAAYVFTRMLTASLVERPNDGKAAALVIRIASWLTALFALLCGALLLMQGNYDLTKYLK